MPRLFTSLELPAEIRDVLWAMRGGLPGARWIEPENYHLTLCFVGDVDDDAGFEFQSALARTRAQPIRIVLDRLEIFGGNRPRALVAGARPDEALAQLRQDHETAARRVGLSVDPRKFTPHVTLARLRSVSASQAAEYIASRGLFRPSGFLAEEFVLLSSKPSTGGGPYVREAAYPLSRADLKR